MLFFWWNWHFATLPTWQCGLKLTKSGSTQKLISRWESICHNFFWLNSIQWIRPDFFPLFSPSFWNLVQFFQLHSALSTILHWLFTDAGKAMKNMYLYNSNMTTVCCEGSRSKDRKESWSRRRTTLNSWNVSHKARPYIRISCIWNFDHKEKTNHLLSSFYNK